MLYNEASFDILSEPWNNYELHDKTILKIKTVLKTLLVNINEKTERMDTSSSFELLWSVGVMPRASNNNPVIKDDKARPYSEDDIEEEYKLPKIDPSFERKPSIYYISGGYYLLGMHDLSYIARTKYCNQAHQPIFIVKGNVKTELLDAKKVY